MATWAKGLDFKNSENTTRIGGVGVYGTDNVTNKIYIGLGTEPWNANGLEITASDITFKGNKLYHQGNKPTPADIGAATSSHNHDSNYLKVTGGTVSGAITKTGDKAGFIISNGDSKTMVYASTTPGEHIFGGSNDGTVNISDYIRIGKDKLEYTTGGSSYQIFHSGNFTASSIGALPLTGGTLTGELKMSGKAIRLLADSGSYPRIGVEADTNDVFISNVNNNWLRLKDNKTMTYAGYKVYTSYEKPTPADIGAAAASHTHSYLPLAGGTLTGNLAMSGTVNRSLSISSTRKAFITLTADTDNVDETDTAYIKFLQDGSAIGGFVGFIGNAGTNPEGGTYTGTEANALALISTSDVNIGAYSKTVMRFNDGTTNSLNDMVFKDTYTVTGVEPYRGVGHSRLAQGDTAGSLRVELFNTSGTTVARNYLFAVGAFYPNGSPTLGYSAARWGQIYSTAGSISTSDSKLKENIEPVQRTEVNLMNDTDQPTSYDFYNYIKGSSVYTFNYKKEISQDTQPWLGILADEIPDNVFNKIGMMSKTTEEHETEIKEQQEAKELLKKIQIPLSIENDELQLKVFGDTIVEGTELTYRELKEKAEKRIEEPIRMINSSAQIAMLQEVLSMSLNKIENLENDLKEKESEILEFRLIIEKLKQSGYV